MSQKKILIVEDEEVIRRLCGRLLSKPLGGADASPPELILVASLKEAFKAIEDNQLDLLITDLRLPDGNGIDIVKSFKKKFPGKKAIVITGSLTPHDQLRQVEGKVECIFKPFEPAVLEAAVHNALEY
jgi:two-component system, NtrC family, response regulator